MKKRMITKIVALLCIVSLSLEMTGCGQKAGKKNSFEPQLDTKKKVELSVSGFFGNFEALDQVLADFNKYYPNVEILYEQNGIDNFEEYIKANTNIDIMMTSEEIFEKYEKLVDSICVDLEKEEIDLSGINPKMLKRGYHNGKLTSIPMGQNMYGLVVNETLLKKEGLKVPSDYKEFITVLTALKKKGYTPIQGPGSKVYAELTQNMVNDMILKDKTLYKDLLAGRKSAAEKLQPVFQKLDEIIKKGFIDSKVNEKYPEDNYDQAILNFLEGDVPFWVCNTEKVSGMKKRESKSETFQKNPFTYTFIYAPLGENGVYEYKEPWFGFSVNKNGKNYDYGMEFIRFLAQKEEINTMANIKGVPSVAADSKDLDIYKDVLNPKKVEMEGTNDGTITSDMVANWYSCVNKYVAGEYENDTVALEDFATMCHK